MTPNSGLQWPVPVPLSMKPGRPTPMPASDAGGRRSFLRKPRMVAATLSATVSIPSFSGRSGRLRASIVWPVKSVTLNVTRWVESLTPMTRPPSALISSSVRGLPRPALMLRLSRRSPSSSSAAVISDTVAGASPVRSPISTRETGPFARSASMIRTRLTERVRGGSAAFAAARATRLSISFPALISLDAIYRAPA